jgi:hypothetical protein
LICVIGEIGGRENSPSLNAEKSLPMWSRRAGVSSITTDLRPPRRAGPLGISTDPAAREKIGTAVKPEETMSSRDEIAQQALSLPPDDRAFLADILEQSLTDEGFTTAEIAQAWTKEIERRLEASDRGGVEALDASAAMEEMRRGLAERRTGKTT